LREFAQIFDEPRYPGCHLGKAFCKDGEDAGTFYHETHQTHEKEKPIGGRGGENPAAQASQAEIMRIGMCGVRRQKMDCQRARIPIILAKRKRPK
jgi:hypothetical protein